MKPAQSFSRTLVSRVNGGPEDEQFEDLLAVEEPLEIRLGFLEDDRPSHRAISITMRTPGDDEALAAGFLFTEGIIKHRDQITDIRFCGTGTNTIRVDLGAGVDVDLKRLQRNFYTTSSCGVCGKTSIEALHTGAEHLTNNGLTVSREVVHRLPQALRISQDIFERTGGLHASALFNRDGTIDIVREDVGRHNALDKVIGRKFLAGELPLSDRILMVSGRASFELVQKALMARIPMLVAVGAPSSLAVELAREFGMTLIGFVRGGRFNIYCGGERISPNHLRQRVAGLF